MKKISALFIAGLITLCFSMSLHAQSSETGLDQVELMKQLIGTWQEAIDDNDTILIWDVKPNEKGYESTFTWQASGKTYATTKGIIGFNGNYKKVNMYNLFPNGKMSRDLGKFDSKKKLVMERFNVNHTHAYAKWEMTFVTKDKIDFIYSNRGAADTWDDATVSEATYIRMK